MTAAVGCYFALSSWTPRLCASVINGESDCSEFLLAALTCPFCKSGSLLVFDQSLTSVTMVCGSCQRALPAKMTATGQIISVAVPAIGVLSGMATIAHFFGVTPDHLKSAFHELLT